MRPQLLLRRLDAVVRLQRRRGDADAGDGAGGAVVPYKPARVVRNVMHAARRLVVEDAVAEEEARHVRAAVKVGAAAGAGAWGAAAAGEAQWGGGDGRMPAG